MVVAGKRVLLISVSSLFLICALFHQTIWAKETMKKRNILIITGGHPFEREPFFEMFKSFGNLSFEERVHPLGEKAYSAGWIKRFDALVFYDMNQEINDEQKSAFLQMLNKGKGVVFLHHSLASYQKWGEFAKILGGKYLLEAEMEEGKTVPASTYRHDAEVRVKIMDTRHPITKGLQDFVLHDEVYGGFITKTGIHPLLQTDHAESTPLIGWTNDYANSRIVFLQSGHDHLAYENGSYRKLVRQAIEWVCK
jgi:uncharacterized protein